MRAARLFLLVAALSALPGCGYLVNGYYQAAGWSSRQWSAEKAWRTRKWMYADMPCPGSFKAGFKAGYRFANGGYDSCEPPQMRHYWRVGNLSDSERQNAQAWSDGFTHGTVAAQQDHAVGVSALDSAAMQPPSGVPDVRYYSAPAPNEMSDGGGSQYPPYDQSTIPYADPSQGSQFAPPGQTYFPYGTNPENFQFAPNAPNSNDSPSPLPPPAPASEAAPAYNGGLPQGLPPLPPPAPGNQPGASMGYMPGPMMASEGAPGTGGLQTVGNLQPAPPAEMNNPSAQGRPSVLPPSPIPQPTEWQLPLMRD
jgi:hypothetical protein